MKNKDKNPTDAAPQAGSLLSVRQRAEQALQKNDFNLPENVNNLTPEAIKQLLHELRVHQIELEMQNEELRETQIALEISRERYFNFYNVAPVGYVTLNEKGLITEVNLTFASLLGEVRSKLLRQPFTNLILKQDQDIYYLHRKQAMGSDTEQSCELRLLRPDNTKLWVKLHSIAALGDGNEPVLRMVLSDINERKLVEAERKKLFLLVENSPDFIGMSDLELKPFYANPAAIKLVGLPSVEEFCKHSVTDFYFPEDIPFLTKEFLPRALSDGHAETVIRLRHFQTGAAIWMNIITFLLIDDSGTPIAWATVSRDINEKRKLELENNSLREQLAQSSKMQSIGYLTAGIAHDFNNILGAMMGYSELSQLLISSGKIGSVGLYQEEILKSGNRAKALISQMLIFSQKSTAGSIDAETPTTELEPVIKEAVDLLRASIPKTIDLKFHLLGNNLRSHIQPVHLHQIILNLGINARDAMGEYGKLDITLSQTHCANQHCSSCKIEYSGDYAQISVQDSDGGIAPENLNKIFDPFFTTKEVGKGIGMGLAVVHGLVHSLGGHIQVESSVGTGTTFHILLPLELSAPISHLVFDARHTINIKGAKIMVVDDEHALSNMLREYLTAQGAQIFAYTDPTLALEAFIEHVGVIDMVITDEAMPGMSGMLFAEKLLKLKPSLPIILCTGYSEHATAETAAKLGITGFLLKPLNLNDLLQKIETLWHKK